MTEDRHIRIEQDGRLLAEAVVHPKDGDDRASAQVHVEPGPLPPGVRTEVADAVHDAVVQDEASRLIAGVPLGDAELVDGMRRHLDDVELRAAGSTSIITGTVRVDGDQPAGQA